MEIKCGIYKITNKINGNCYVGQSVNIFKRWSRHKEQNEQKKQHLPLYRAIKKYGIDNFEFRIIEECKKELLNERELYYYNLLNPKYNILIPNQNPMDNQLAKWRYEKKYFNNESSKIRSEKLKKRWNNEEYRKKMIEVSSVPCSEERKRNISQGKKNKKKVIMKDLFSLEILKEFESLSEAKRWLRENGYPKAECSPISNVCKGTWQKAYNYFWVFQESQTTIRKE